MQPQLEMSASLQDCGEMDIKKAYRWELLKHHPDKVRCPFPSTLETSMKVMGRGGMLFRKVAQVVDFMYPADVFGSL